MTRKTSLLSAAIASALFSAGIQAALPSAQPGFTLDGSASSATFAGGPSVNGGAGFVTEWPRTSNAGFGVRIDVSAEDVGREGDLYQVFRISTAQGDVWYQHTAQGLLPWNADPASLQPLSTKVLAARERVEVIVPVSEIEAALGGPLAGTQITTLVGYMDPEGSLHYSPEYTGTVAAVSNSCPAGTQLLGAPTAGAKDLCVLSGTYTQDLHLNSNFDYVLSGAVFIGGDNSNSAELTIDAGTTVYGESGADFLVINRGSKIHANGAPNAPIIMTSASDASATSSTRGQWGGLIINGNAPINGCSADATICESQGEGSSGLYGGNDPMDDSGTLNYLQVKYAGYEITPENELNGIAFQGVGAGTVVDYVQVHNNSDDGVEFFGGTVNAKHLVLTGISDDSLDWTKGWQGKVQHVVIVQTDEGDQGFESDSNSSNQDSLPRSLPTIANVTMLGNSNTDIGMLLRVGTGARMSNMVVSGFGDACIDIDDAATFNNAGSSATNLSGELTMTHSIVDCDVNFAEAAGDPWSVESWFVNQQGNQVGGANMNGYRNSAAVNAMPAASLTDAFFDQVDYVGAVPDAARDWTLGWTFREALDAQ